jgi:hypothetical protein
MEKSRCHGAPNSYTVRWQRPESLKWTSIYQSWKSCCLPAKSIFTSFLNSSKYEYIGRQPSCTQFLPEVVTSHCRRSTWGDSRTGSDKTLYREETRSAVLEALRVGSELTWGISGCFSFVTNFCDTTSDHCITRTITQRTKLYINYLQSMRGEGRPCMSMRETNRLAHIYMNRDISRAHSFPRAAEFRADRAAEFAMRRGISRKMTKWPCKTEWQQIVRRCTYDAKWRFNDTNTVRSGHTTLNPGAAAANHVSSFSRLRRDPDYL